MRRGMRRVSVFAVVALAGCDFSVTNPGPIPDVALDNPEAAEPVVNGMRRALSRALGYVAYTGAAVGREIVASGSQNSQIFGITIKQRAGDLDPSASESNEHWRLAQQARWIADDGVRRMRESLGSDFASSGVAARALVFSGFANRLLGENMCDGIIDGGPLESRKIYFDRAEAAFTEAMAIATAAGDAELLDAARAGRASVRVWLDDWTGAMSDAAVVPTAFAFKAAYSGAEQDQYNRIFWASANQPHRSHSVVGTFFEGYYLTTQDPRTPWSTDPNFPRGTMNVLWYFQRKYTSTSSPINLASGREMRLIIAEGRLRSGDWESAMALINGLRSGVGVPPWSASDPAGAWTALVRERAIELWLEGRRLGDLYRWDAGNVPGERDDMTGRDLCFPIGISELETNPNLR
jgi:hypothetical protein